jgi:aspartate aminotransferase-like enzyme
VNRRLFTVGPVEVRAEVLEAMAREMIVHRGQAYRRLHEGIVDKLHKVLETDMHIILAASSSSGFMESCVRCGVRERMLGIANGSFGERWQAIGTANGKQVRRVDVPWGKAVRPEHLEDQMDDAIEAVTLVSNESSTGVFNPVDRLVSHLREKHDPLLFVDGVTSVGAVDLRLDALDIDALVFGTQKAFALPPGLAIICVSDRMLEKARTVNSRGYYFDLLELKSYADKGYTLTTPPISLLFGLDFQLDRMLEEGMPARYRRHREMADLVRDWAIRRRGLFAEEGYRSNTITVVENGGTPFPVVQEALGRRGYEISSGYGKIKDETFRIGHMGDLTVQDVRGLLEAMDEVMEELT